MPYTATPTALPDVIALTPKVFGDARGFFFESYNQQDFADATGVHTTFVQDNHSKSAHGVLRGLHYQMHRPQGKLVRVVQGRVLDVAVDLRRSSATFGKAVAVELSDANHRQLWVPPGFAHGFVVLSASAEFLYKTTDYWYPEHERSLLWNDPALGIDWRLGELEGAQIGMNSSQDSSGDNGEGSSQKSSQGSSPQKTTLPLLAPKDAAAMTLAQAIAQGQVYD